MPLISVVTPCYNAQTYLSETIASVFAQSHGKFELILVDDGSTDATRELIHASAEHYGGLVVPIYSDNGGAAAARNLGLQHARGEYVQFLDADDLLYPTALERKLQALCESGADVVHTGWQKLKESDPGLFVPGDVVMRDLSEIDPDPAISLLTNFWAPPAALLYTRDIVERIGGWKQHLAPIEDARYMLDAVLQGGRYVHVPEVLASYRIFHAPSHSRRSPLKFVLAVLRNAIEIENVWRQAGRLHERERLALASVFDYVARELFTLDATSFEQALTHLYSARPGFQLTWPKLAGLMKRTFGQRITQNLLRAVGKLPTQDCSAN